jgi:hypothetical protein
MAESAENRSRAAKLAKRVKAGKALPPADAAWLRAYKARVAAERAKQKPPTAFRFSGNRVERLPAAEAKALAAAPRVTVDEYQKQQEQLELAGTGTVHETVPVEGSVAPEASTWIPETPPAAPDAEPPPPGAPPPPSAGTPLVDEATASASSAPPPDPAAAAQYAGLVVFVAAAGIASAIELMQDIEEIPPFVRAKLEDADEHGKFLHFVGEATQRLVVKYNIRAVPMADEAVVGGTLVASVLAYLAVQKKKKLAASKPAAPRVAQQQQEAPRREEQKAPPASLARFLEPSGAS